MEKSTHKVEVVPIELLPHENAEKLSIVKVGGYQVCCRTADWEGVEIGAYIPPDSLVDTERPEFSFLHKNKRWERVKVMKLRGIISMGLLVPVPSGSVVGDNVADILNVEHYEPPEPMSTGGECVKAPEGWFPKYDIDTIRKYDKVFEDDEQVYISEKCHGANAKYVYKDGAQYCGSRSQWKKESETDVWWQAFHKTPQIKEFCESNEGVVLWGEIYGKIQNLNYGVKSGVKFVAFDILDHDRWLNPKEFINTVSYYCISSVPILAFNVPFSMELVEELAEGKSLLGGDHVREGCVVKPMIERDNPTIGRVVLKLVGNGYYQKV